KRIDRFFHGIADEDHGIYLLPLALGECMLQDLADLRPAAKAGHGRHLLQQIVGAIEPRAGNELTETAVECELDIETAEGGRLLEHFSLDMAGAVPRRLPAGRGIESKQQPASLTLRRPRRRRRRQLTEEGVDLAAGRRLIGQPASITRHITVLPLP